MTFQKALAGIAVYRRLLNPVHLKYVRMSTFVSQINRITGKMEWDFRDEDYDYKQEIARSAYADMLHDTERNQLYYRALEVAVRKQRQRGNPVHVLDIGTGTGLLSMMAARLGADTVHACEAFTPMAECAEKIIETNGFGEKIKLIPKRSTDLTVGQGKDLPHKANVLVTEVFDTELIGEGAIGTFTHAHQHLLEEDCLVVPSYANLYVQLVTSDLVKRWNRIDDLVVNGNRVTAPESIFRCGGAPSLHDLQLDQLSQDTFTVLSKPLKVFRFDFTGATPLPFDDTSILDCVMENSGSVDAVFMWWDLEMDPDSSILLSCAPRWAHPTPNNMQWRDHWMQAIYYPYSNVTVAKDEKVKVISKHDEYSLWFDVAKENSKDSSSEERPLCRCGAHITYGRSRMGMLSDPVRIQVFVEVLRKKITPETTCLCISDGSLLPLIVAQLGAKHVYTLESNHMCYRTIKEFVKHNGLQEKVTVLERSPDNITREDLPDTIDLVIGEPVFLNSLLPWDNMCYWYLSQHLAQFYTDATVILPWKMAVYAVAVNYADLWKIRADVGVCEGFNLQHFDKLIQVTSDQVDENVEPHPLWEYPCTAAGEAGCLLKVDFTRSVELTSPVEVNISLPVKSGQSCNGVAMWAQFDFDDGHVISTGPRQPVRTGEKIVWDYYSKQGVHLFYNNSRDSGQTDTSVDVNVTYTPDKGELGFKFYPEWS